MSLAQRFVPNPPAPGKLLIVLHGRGDSMDGFAWLPQALGLAGLGYMFLNAPDDYFGGYSWYDLPPDQAPGILRSRRLLFELLDELAAKGWDPADVVLFGFSQGCLMALDVAARYPRRLGGVCGISGYVYFMDELAAETLPHAKEMPWWVSAGSQDEVVPLDATQMGVEALKAAGVPVDWHVYPKGHTIDPVRELPEVRTWLASAIHPRQA
jgi:phospholipase/carboxylesterase